MAYFSRYFLVLSKQGPPFYRHGFGTSACKYILKINFATDSRFALTRHNIKAFGGKSLINNTRNFSYQLSRTPLSCIIDCRLRFISTSRVLLAQEPWMISDYEVNSMIAAEEISRNIKDGIIQRFESNQLGSNNPIEDRKFIAKLLHGEGGYLFGVLDGHGGDQCARSVCQRISNYIALRLMSNMDLSEFNSVPKLVEYICMSSNEYHDYSYIDNPVCQKHFHEHFKNLQQDNGSNVQPIKRNIPSKQKMRGLYAKVEELQDSQLAHKVSALTNAFLTLDEDISREALILNNQGEVNEHLFNAANSGACALVAHLNGTELCIANAGDCRAVLGTENPDNTLSAIQLTSDHTTGNPEEVERIVSQHPKEEATTCIQYERLLKRLAPLRALGDVRFKWDTETQKKIYKQFPVITYFTEKEHYYTPPYLTAEPEVTTYQLQRSDKFLVLATDGLWDMLSNEEVVNFVQKHLKKRELLPANKQAYQITLNEHEIPCELTNTASSLIREALGGDDHIAVSSSLNVPYSDTRQYRDDMTVIVVFFDWDQLEVPIEGEEMVM